MLISPPWGGMNYQNNPLYDVLRLCDQPKYRPERKDMKRKESELSSSEETLSSERETRKEQKREKKKNKKQKKSLSRREETLTSDKDMECMDECEEVVSINMHDSASAKIHGSSDSSSSLSEISNCSILNAPSSSSSTEFSDFVKLPSLSNRDDIEFNTLQEVSYVDNNTSKSISNTTSLKQLQCDINVASTSFGNIANAEETVLNNEVEFISGTGSEDNRKQNEESEVDTNSKVEPKNEESEVEADTNSEVKPKREESEVESCKNSEVKPKSKGSEVKSDANSEVSFKIEESEVESGTNSETNPERIDESETGSDDNSISSSSNSIYDPKPLPSLNSPDLVRLAKQASDNLVLYLPKNSNLEQVSIAIIISKISIRCLSSVLYLPRNGNLEQVSKNKCKNLVLLIII